MAELERGATVGRYVVIARLGAGAMGVVYAAYDPDLDRKVALKLLAARGDQRRLLREAQAMAKLSHPNVVAVHDVGEHDGRVFVAMEFVDGETLGSWLAREHPRWPNVLRTFDRAGRGLQAAHGKGLVHRDLKPDNIMIDRDGRVRVMDFGLAHVDANAPATETANGESRREEEMLTQHGAVVGTPAYMAPEQIRGDEVGPPTDQFAFCIGLWEALYGERPFRGATVVDLAACILAGEITEPPSGARVPGWLRRCVQRGLQVDPQRRWPSMRHLLVALARGRARARWRAVGVTGVAVALLAAGSAAWRHYDERRRAEACADDGATIAEIWNDDARERLREGVLGAGTRYGTATADRVVPWLDAYASAWEHARTEACLDVDVRAASSATAFDRSVACLADRRLDLEALVDALATGDEPAVRGAVEAAAGLPPIDPCTDPARLALLPGPPARDTDAQQRVRSELARVAALEATGGYDEGVRVAAETVAEANAIGWPPLTAAARLAHGRMLDEAGRHAEAELELEECYFEAGRAGAIEVAVDCAEALVSTVGVDLARHTEGVRWSRHSALFLASLPDTAHTLEARHASNLASVRYETGDYADARALQERVLAIREEVFGPDHPAVARSLNNLAVVHLAAGAHAEAKVMQQRALSIRERALGPDHPEIATTLGNLAITHEQLGEYEQARALHARALRIREQALGPDHPDVALSLNNLATVEEQLGSYPEAKLLYERALAIRIDAFGPRHPNVAVSLNNLAALRLALGENAEAREPLERALQIWEKVYGPDHAEVAYSLNNLGIVYERLDDFEGAKRSHARALAIRERSLGPEHPLVGASLDNLAKAHRLLGELDEAKRLHERALAIGEKALGRDHVDVAYALVGLAEIALAQDRAAEAIQLAERALRLRENGGAPATTLDATRSLIERARAAADPTHAAH